MLMAGCQIFPCSESCTLSLCIGESSALTAAADQSVKVGRNPSTQVGDPERRNNAGKYIHGVMRAQDQHRCHLENDEQDSANREPIPAQAGDLNRPENRDSRMPREEKIVGYVIGHQ